MDSIEQRLVEMVIDMDFTALLLIFSQKLDSREGSAPTALHYSRDFSSVITTGLTIAGPEVHASALVRSMARKEIPQRRALIYERRFQAENIPQNLPLFVNDVTLKPEEERTAIRSPLNDTDHHRIYARSRARTPRCTGSFGSDSSIEVTKC